MSRKKIDISGLDKAAVLAALYNSAKPQGMGFLHYDPKPMTREDAFLIIHLRGDDKTAMFSASGIVEPAGPQNLEFDYLKGRVMKVDISGNEFDPWGYDRDNGEGEAERVIQELRELNQVNSANSQAVHHVNTLEAAEEVKDHLDDPTFCKEGDGVAEIHLGYSDVADKLGPAVDEAVKKRRE